MSGKSTTHDARTRQMPALTEVLAEWEQASRSADPQKAPTRRVPALPDDDPTEPVEALDDETDATRPMAALDADATREMPAFHDEDGTAPTLQLEGLADDV